jgi:hypothetical protein
MWNKITQNSICFLFREADIEDPPDNIVHERYEGERFWKKKSSR